MFSQLWKRLTNCATSKEEKSARVALAACLALARREETIRQAEEKRYAGKKLIICQLENILLLYLIITTIEIFK